MNTKQVDTQRISEVNPQQKEVWVRPEIESLGLGKTQFVHGGFIVDGTVADAMSSMS